MLVKVCLVPVFQPRYESSLFAKEEMPGVETIMVFVKEENERLEEEVCTLIDMKGVCQSLHIRLHISAWWL